MGKQDGRNHGYTSRESFTVYEKCLGLKDSDGKVYSAGSAYKMPRRNVTFTAMWEHDVWMEVQKQNKEG